MFRVDNKTGKIEMNEGDFGEILTFHNLEPVENSFFKVKIKKNKELVFEKNLSNISGTEATLSFTKDETQKLNKGNYTWSLVQYLDEKLYSTIVKNNILLVEEGA